MMKDCVLFSVLVVLLATLSGCAQIAQGAVATTATPADPADLAEAYTIDITADDFVDVVDNTMVSADSWHAVGL